jgi:hypothetical protein
MFMLDNGNGLTRKEVKSLANLRLAKTAVALERFHGTHQNIYPDSLAELAPEFLPQIPKDPYDGQPLRYHKTTTGYQLYSVGPNLRDDGGQRGKQDDGDIVFEVVKPVDHLKDSKNQAAAKDKTAKPDPQQQLKDLKVQFDQGKIDQQTYEQKKSIILNSL